MTAHADVITVTGTFTVTNAHTAPEFVNGDVFDFSFTFDDAMADTNASTFGGQFRDAVSELSLTRNPGNTGTWDPAGGTFDVSPVSGFATNDNGDNMEISGDGTGFPSVGGEAFRFVSFFFGGFPNDFIDNGLGQTFAELVGVSPLDFTTSTSGFGEIAFEPDFNNVTEGSVAVTTSVAVPGRFPGDADNDGDVDLADFNILASNFGLGPGAPGGFDIGDFDENGSVNLADFNLLAANFGLGTVWETASALPEPGAMALFSVVGFVAMRRRSIIRYRA